MKKSSLFLLPLLTLGLVLATLTTGCGKGKTLPGLSNLHTDVVAGKFYISFLTTLLQWDTGVTLPIPGLSDASLSVAPDFKSNGVVFQFSVGLSSLIGDAQNGKFPLSALPDGRAIPGVLGGVLPRWDLTLDPSKSYRLSFYLSGEALGLFVPLPIRFPAGAENLMVSQSIKDSKGNRLGVGYAIPGSGNDQSGLLLLLSIPSN
jgi:hypothetical protein